MADPATGATTSGSSASTGSNSWLTQLESFAGDVGSGLGLVSGIRRGGVQGDIQAATSAAKLTGLGTSPLGTLSADVNALYNIYGGMQRGGVSGYGSAVVGAAQLGGQIAPFLAKEGLVSAATSVGMEQAADAANVLAVPLSLYNFAKSWQSGATGADALAGAETGASIGTDIAPGIGTAVGAVVGAAAGAVSSLFGPGREDPENIGWNEYAQAYSKGGAQGVSGATPSQNYQMLAGIFDSRGSNIPFYGKYGRMGEGQFTSDMTKQINSALAQGKISQSSTPQQIYSQVVEPWINSMSPGGWQNTSTVQGAPEKAAIGNLLTSMIGQWQSGQLTSQSQLGISGQADAGIQSFGAQGYNPQAYQQQQSIIQQMQSQLESTVNSLSTALGVTARHG